MKRLKEFMRNWTFVMITLAGFVIITLMLVFAATGWLLLLAEVVGLLAFSLPGWLWIAWLVCFLISTAVVAWNF